jgi:hypothetical protein
MRTILCFHDEQDRRIERLERENRELRAPPLEGPARASPPISIAP